MLDIQIKHVKQIGILEQNLKRLQSEYNVLKKTFMDTVDDCVESKHKLREKNKKLNESFNKIREDYNKLLEFEQNKGWNDL